MSEFKGGDKVYVKPLDGSQGYAGEVSKVRPSGYYVLPVGQNRLRFAPAATVSAL